MTDFAFPKLNALFFQNRDQGLCQAYSYAKNMKN